MASTERLSHAATKARALTKRGVRRVFAIDVERERVLGWSRETDAWQMLGPNDAIDDPCFVRPLPIAALVSTARVDDAIARALLAKKNPVLEAAVEAAEARGEAKGRAQGTLEGKARGRVDGQVEGLRLAVYDLCAVLDIPLGKSRARKLASLDVAALEALRGALNATRRWPTRVAITRTRTIP